jgi:hypothetical protein
MFTSCRSRLILLSLALALWAPAGELLTLRLVEARNLRGPAVDDRELADVQQVLKSSLPFNSFTVLDTQQTRLPANSTLKLRRDFAVECRGEQGNLTLRVEREGRQLLTTNVQLQDGKPLILGGFTVDGGKLILVLVAR